MKRASLRRQLATEVPSVENGGISQDGLSWRIKLRPDVKWHDGQPFTADDVKFTLDLVNNPNFRAFSRAGHELVTDITVVSPTEITWRMKKVFAPYPSILSWTFIVPAHILAKASDPNTSSFNNSPVGTGPFKWGERQAGDHVTLTANEHYFGTGPYLERVVFRYIPDLTVLFTQFQTGAVDYTGIQGITADHYAEAKKLPDRTIVAGVSPFVESITMNLGKPVFQDLAVREALYAGMNKQAIIDAIYYGLPKPTETYLPSQSWAYNADLPKQVHDPDKAKKILDDAGWKPGSDGIREKNGVKLSFTNSTTAGNHVREQAQELLQQDWKTIGADMQIKNMPAAVIWGDYYNLSKYELGHGRTGPDDGPRSGRDDLLRQHGHSRERRRRAEHDAVCKSRGGQAAGRRCLHPGSRQTRGDLQADGRESSGMICRCCRSSTTRRSKARRQS